MNGQINLRLPETLRKAAEKYVKNHGYKNIQELATESLREKIIEDDELTKKEILLIENILEKSLSEKKLVSEKELERVFGAKFS